ncbi:MAG: cupredoxin domain-containing protein [Gammaproteobacteria bacterium]
MKKLIALITLLAVHGLVPADENNTFVATTNEIGEQEIVMQASSYAYYPNKIIVQAGVPVVLKINKEGWVPHDLIIDDPASGLNIKQKLGKNNEVRFTPENKGEFVFYCGKKLPFAKSHKDKGMHGIIIVE